MIPMPAGLVRGLWRAVECPSMTIGGCLSSRRTFSTLMELWTRLWSLFQSLRQCAVCVCVRKCTCACVSNVNVCVFHFSQLKTWFLVLFPRKCSCLQSRKKTKSQSLLIHIYLCYTGSLTWQKLLPHPLFPVNNANKTALICSTFTTFSDLWPVSSMFACVCVCARSRRVFNVHGACLRDVKNVEQNKHVGFLWAKMYTHVYTAMQWKSAWLKAWVMCKELQHHQICLVNLTV